MLFRYGQANREHMIAIEKTVYYPHKSQDREYMSQDGGGTHREAPGSVFRQRKGDLWIRAFLVGSAGRDG